MERMEGIEIWKDVSNYDEAEEKKGHDPRNDGELSSEHRPLEE
jgi:hypothetical protein